MDNFEENNKTANSTKKNLNFTNSLILLIVISLITLAYLAVYWNFKIRINNQSSAPQAISNFSIRPYSIVVHEAKEENEAYRDAYELFDKHFSQLLTVLSILITIFGLGVPAIAYFFQRQSLKEEKAIVQREFELKLKEFQRKMNKSITEVSSTINNKIEERNDALQNTMDQINSKIHSDVDTAITDLRKKLIDKVNESINTIDAKVNETEKKLLASKEESLNNLEKTQILLDEKIGNVVTKIEKHDEKMDGHDKKIINMEQNINFSFGYFAQQLGMEQFNQKKYFLSTVYYLIAADAFSKAENKQRSKTCMSVAYDALKNINDKTLKHDLFDGYHSNLRSFEENMASDEEALNILAKVKNEIDKKLKEDL